MKASLPVVFLVAAALLVPVGGATAGPVTVSADLVIGVARLSNQTSIILHARNSTVQVGQRIPPVVHSGGSLRTFDSATNTQTQEACTINTISATCDQVNLLCGPTLVPHQAIAAIPNTTFNGSFDGFNVTLGTITVKCIDFPPVP